MRRQVNHLEDTLITCLKGWSGGREPEHELGRYLLPLGPVLGIIFIAFGRPWVSTMRYLIEKVVRSLRVQRRNRELGIVSIREI